MIKNSPRFDNVNVTMIMMMILLFILLWPGIVGQENHGYKIILKAT